MVKYSIWAAILGSTLLILYPYPDIHGGYSRISVGILNLSVSITKPAKHQDYIYSIIIKVNLFPVRSSENLSDF